MLARQRCLSPGIVGGVCRLLVEGDDLAIGARLDDAEVDGLLLGHGDRRDRHAGAAVDVVLDHLARVHAVDVVGAEDAHDVGALVVDAG